MACDLNCNQCSVWSKSLFSDLNPEELQSLQSLKETKTISRNNPVFRQGDPTAGLFCIASGGIKIIQTNNKTDKIIRIAPPGDTVGHRSIFLDKTFKGSAIALSDSQVCFIPMNAINGMLNSNPGFAKKLITRMALEINKTENEHLAHKIKNVRERFAGLLLDLAHNYSTSSDNGNIIDLKLTRSEIAQLIGAAEDTIIRLFSEFRDEGWILETDKKINILKPEMLKELTGQVQD